MVGRTKRGGPARRARYSCLTAADVRVLAQRPCATSYSTARTARATTAFTPSAPIIRAALTGPQSLRLDAHNVGHQHRRGEPPEPRRGLGRCIREGSSTVDEEQTPHAVVRVRNGATRANGPTSTSVPQIGGDLCPTVPRRPHRGQISAPCQSMCVENRSVVALSTIRLESPSRQKHCVGEPAHRAPTMMASYI